MTAEDPIARFAALFERARREEPADPTAMALATADAQGRPSVRMVLLKGADDRGFVFFTNHNSRKARELAENARAALCVHWPTLAVQVRVEGGVETVSDAESGAANRGWRRFIALNYAVGFLVTMLLSWWALVRS